MNIINNNQIIKHKYEYRKCPERGMWETCNYSKGILEKGLTEGLKKGKLDAYVDAVKKLTASGFELLKAIETIVPEEYKDSVLAKLKADDDRYVQG